MATCMNCGLEIKPGMKFCENCGAPVPAEPQAAPPAGGSYQAPAAPQGGYTPPAAGGYQAPTAPQGNYAPPAQGNYQAPVPPQGGYAPPAAGSYQAPGQPAQGPYAPLPQGGYQPPTPPQGGFVPPAGPMGAAPAAPKKGGGAKVIIIVLIVLALLGGIGFAVSKILGGGKAPANDPVLGAWTATTGEMAGVSMDIKELFEKGFTVELKDKGKCKLNVDGETANGKWTLDGTAFHIEGGGVDCDGTLKDGVMVLQNVMGSGVNITFQKDGYTSGGAASGGAFGKPAPASADTDEGIYVIESAVEAGQAVSMDDIKALGMDKTYVELWADGTAEMYTMEKLTTGTWADGKITIDGETANFTREGDKLTLDLGDGLLMTFARAAEKPEVSVTGGYDIGTWETLPNPETLHNTNWYGWIRYENFWGDIDYNGDDVELFDAWGYIGTTQDGSKEYFEICQEAPDGNPAISMWAKVYDDHIEPIVDKDAWVLDHTLQADEAGEFKLSPSSGALSLFWFPVEADDGSWGCTVSFYLRIDGAAWDEEWDILPPGYDAYKANLAA